MLKNISSAKNQKNVIKMKIGSVGADAGCPGGDDPGRDAHARREIRRRTVRRGQHEKGAAGAAISGTGQEAHPVHHLRVLAAARLL